MRESYKRCTHCNDVYLCLLSGHSPRTTHSDGRFCPACLEVVNRALSEVPRKFERDLVPTEAVDLATLLDWEREAAAEREARGGLQVRRVSMPLFNLSTGETSRQGFVRGRDSFAGRNFHYQFWPGRESEAEIKEEVERDLLTGVVRPWQSY